MMFGSPMVKLVTHADATSAIPAMALPPSLKNFLVWAILDTASMALSTKLWPLRRTITASPLLPWVWRKIVPGGLHVPFKWNVRAALVSHYRLQGVGDIQLAVHRVVMNRALLGHLLCTSMEDSAQDTRLPILIPKTGGWQSTRRILMWVPIPVTPAQTQCCLQLQAAGFVGVAFLSMEPQKQQVLPVWHPAVSAGCCLLSAESRSYIEFLRLMAVLYRKIGRDINASGSTNIGTRATGSYAIFGLNVKWKNFCLRCIHPFTSKRRWVVKARSRFKQTLFILT